MISLTLYYEGNFYQVIFLSEQAITHTDKNFQLVYCNAYMQLELLRNVSSFRHVTG